MRMDLRLVFWGVCLFLCSLLTGLLLAGQAPFVVNPRAVLAGHVEGAMNGMFVAMVGLFFPALALSSGQARLCRALLLYAAFANWFFTTLSGVLGTSDATPIAGSGFKAGPMAEQAMTLGFVSVAVTMLVAVGLLLAGLYRRAGTQASA